jgi:hypothetical protein
MQISRLAFHHQAERRRSSGCQQLLLLGSRHFLIAFLEPSSSLTSTTAFVDPVA